MHTAVVDWYNTLGGLC